MSINIIRSTSAKVMGTLALLLVLAGTASAATIRLALNGTTYQECSIGDQIVYSGAETSRVSAYCSKPWEYPVGIVTYAHNVYQSDYGQKITVVVSTWGNKASFTAHN